MIKSFRSAAVLLQALLVVPLLARAPLATGRPSGNAAAKPCLTQTTRPLPCDICLPGVTNFARVDTTLWRGAQPSSDGFQALKAAGVRTVVNLRTDHDDAPMLRGTGLHYLWLPSRAWRLHADNLAIFLKVVENPTNWPVFVHCAEGRDRTGYNIAAYRIVVQGWKPDEAIREMDTFHYRAIWFLNPGLLRDLNVVQMRERVKAMSEPALEMVP